MKQLCKKVRHFNDMKNWKQIASYINISSDHVGQLRSLVECLTPLLKYVSKTLSPQSLLFSSGASWYMACQSRTEVWTTTAAALTQPSLISLQIRSERERKKAVRGGTGQGVRKRERVEGLMRNKREEEIQPKKRVWDDWQTSYFSRGSELATVFTFTLRLYISHPPGLSVHPIAPSQIVFLAQIWLQAGRRSCVWQHRAVCFVWKQARQWGLGPSRETTHDSQSMKSSFGVSMLHSKYVYLHACPQKD